MLSGSVLMTSTYFSTTLRRLADKLDFPRIRITEGMSSSLRTWIASSNKVRCTFTNSGMGRRCRVTSSTGSRSEAFSSSILFKTAMILEVALGDVDECANVGSIARYGKGDGSDVSVSSSRGST
jgi:hypothetical protein